MDQDGTWHGGGPRSRPHCARWGPSSLPQKEAEPPSPIFNHFYCGQTAGCIKMPLAMEVGLSPGDFVLDGDPAPSPKRRQSLQFSAHVYCGQTAAWIKMQLGTGGRPQPTRHCVRWGPSSPSPKESQPHNFRSMSVVAKRLDGLRCHLVWR